ncbi:Argininosuccinate synthase [Candidatus Tremblaya princeps]|uniref:argininosuccinate synthase n=1 Tax=Tremblaya princeps TaxID=189385 RepID=A0A143WNJ2_TREPR|nr:Argininosuccinate synthase [Candidatus Tremblaya princeps]
MARIISRVPRGERVGVAFSGGLDTCATLCWIRREGALPHAYVADTGQPDEPDLDRTAIRAIPFGAERSVLVDCREHLACAGVSAVRCGAFHVCTAGVYYLNTTPISRAIIGVAISARMEQDGIHTWCDGSTHKGNDIERFHIYSSLWHPGLRVYKPWLDPGFVGSMGSRAKLEGFIASCGLAWSVRQTLPYSMDASLLGVSYEGKSLERLDTGSHDVTPSTPSHKGTVRSTRRLTLTLHEGWPVGLDGRQYASTAELLQDLNRLGGAYGVGVSDQVEDRILGLKSRGVYEAPGLTILFAAYDRLLTCSHDACTIAYYRRCGARLGRYLYAGRWYSPAAVMLRDSMERWVARFASGDVTLTLRTEGPHTPADTFSAALAYASADASMDDATYALRPRDRAGQLSVADHGTRGVACAIVRFGLMGALELTVAGVPATPCSHVGKGGIRTHGDGHQA